MKKKMALSDIRLEDVVEINPSWSPFDCLMEVRRIARDKYDTENHRLSLLLPWPVKKQRSPSLKKPVNHHHIQTPTNHFSTPKKPIKRLPLRSPMKKHSKKPIINNLFLENLASDHQNLIINGEKKKTKKYNGPNQPPDMPIWMRNRIGEIGGSNIQLLIQKALFATDLSIDHNRLSMPVNDVRSEFLTDDEKARLKMKEGKKRVGIDALLIDSGLNEFRTQLKMWDMNSQYALVKPWKFIAKANQFVEDDILQVWSFRTPKSQLCFALVQLPTQAEDAAN